MGNVEREGCHGGVVEVVEEGQCGGEEGRGEGEEGRCGGGGGLWWRGRRAVVEGSVVVGKEVVDGKEGKRALGNEEIMRVKEYLHSRGRGKVNQ